MKKIALLFVTILTFFCFISKENKEKDNTKPTISLSFDDGKIIDMPNYKLENWNNLLLENLKKNHLKAILFSAGGNKTSEKGKYLLNSWNNAGHLIANHTMSHPNFNSKNTSLENFEWELTANDSIIKKYSNYLPYFRFPYLKEGNTAEKVTGFRVFMKEKGYRNGHVTIDASDWYIDGRLVERLTKNPKANIEGFRAFYVQHLYDRAMYYEDLAFQLTGRHINHVILLHHNLVNALFLGDLIQNFKAKGWNTIDADKAYQDKIYEKAPSNVPAGESLIWALAKELGKLEKQLRYPAEDGDYEKEKMDKLGL
jgi:peptidoglycan-N-acetylglucosamine deacetylase